MKSTLSYILFLCCIFICLLIIRSCANTTMPPSGGDKDSIPPLIEKMLPPDNTINHAREPRESKISFEFNEYVVIKDAIKNIYLSPPQAERLESKIKGRQVIISFPKSLDSNTTYSLDLGQGIVDNNEGNVFPRFVYSFSTGETIDSLFTSGSAVDATTVQPMENITILFHTDHSDSAVFNTLPQIGAKSDIWGYFAARNMKADSFSVYAITDLNNNNKYDPANEMIAFLDSLYTPTLVMNNSLPQLASYDIKDTIKCLSRPIAFQLNLFKEVSSRQLLKNKGRLGERMLYITFAAPYVEIDSLAIEGFDSSKLIKQFNVTQDSLAIWLDDQSPIPDTLLLSINYMKTNDSLKTLVLEKEVLKLIAPMKKKIEDRRGRMIEVKDTSAKFELIVQPETVEQDGYTLEFEYPLLKAPFNSLEITAKTTREQIIKEKFTVTQDSTNIRKYVIKLDNKMILGYEYTFKIPPKLFVDINGLPCDSLVKVLSLPNNDDLSSLSLDLTNVNGHYLVQLLNESRSNILRSYRISKNSKLDFPYLVEGKYSIRITEDKNNNGIIDTGSLLERRQPEKVLLYKLGEGLSNEAYLIDLPERTELEQSINVEEMFK